MLGNGMAEDTDRKTLPSLAAIISAFPRNSRPTAFRTLTTLIGS
jgi:hypothetical protein